MSTETRPLAERFMQTLQQFEADGKVDPLVALFADDADAANLTHKEQGRDGVRKFWEDYRGAFREVRSAFKAVIAGDGGAALEWESEGALPTGAPIRYRGVSLLEFAGDKVKRFRTYYDSAAFVAPAVA